MSFVSEIIEENRKNEIKQLVANMKKMIEVRKGVVSTELSLDYQNGWLDAAEHVYEMLIGD